MTKNSDTPAALSYPEFLISAINDEAATAFAEENNLPDGSWFRLPSTLEDAPEAFRKESTPVRSKEEWAAMSKEEYDVLALNNIWNDRILFATDLASAARYAGERNWWLHAWKFVASPELGEEVVEYGFYC